jgi:hypothetical protein
LSITSQKNQNTTEEMLHQLQDHPAVFIEIVVRLRNTSYSLDSKDNKCNLREIFCSNNVIQLQAIGYQEICTLDIVVKLSEV